LESRIPGKDAPSSDSLENRSVFVALQEDYQIKPYALFDDRFFMDLRSFPSEVEHHGPPQPAGNCSKDAGVLA